MSILITALAALCALAALPVLVLSLQVLLAHGGRRAAASAVADRTDADVAVLIPAHNEAAGIAATLRCLQSQLRSGDRVLVVADNCSDDTAALARQAGAEVIERSDAVARGKGFALDFGVRHLSARPPAMVLIVDADCLLDAGALETLSGLCGSSGRPVQALYEMNAPAGAGLRARVSAFAWRVRNRVRPLGWWVVGAPCQLMGTGMMFPWALLRDAPLASGHIAEDVQLGADLALRGKPPLFAPQARVTSTFPEGDAAAASQRRRWEHGNLALMFAHGPRCRLAPRRCPPAGAGRRPDGAAAGTAGAVAARPGAARCAGVVARRRCTAAGRQWRRAGAAGAVDPRCLAPGRPRHHHPVRAAADRAGLRPAQAADVRRLPVEAPIDLGAGQA
jgi:Glycosyltransferase like family 2